MDMTPPPRHPHSRLHGAASRSAALVSHGLYRLADTIAGMPSRRRQPPPAELPQEQHLLLDVPSILDNGIEVVVPPLHLEVVTATLKLEGGRDRLRQAQRELENALASVEETLSPSPSGLGMTVAWGLPYFRRYVPEQAETYLPIDHRATQAEGTLTRAVLDAVRFPSDPEDLILEENDVALVLRSDSLDHIAVGASVFSALADLFHVTSIRKAFMGGGFGGQRSLPKRMALEAGIPGATSIPETAELFMGFSSTQSQSLGQGRIANFETIPGLTDQWPGGYFRHGCAMHLSHVFEDLEAWYGHDFERRAGMTFRPDIRVPEGTLTVPEGPEQAADEATIIRHARDYATVGHSSSIQPAVRLPADLVDNYGDFHPKGTAIPQRADSNTLDNPFFWTHYPDIDRYSPEPRAGLLFVVFTPTSDAFHRGRRSMDGHYPDGQHLPLSPNGPAMGFNSVLRATHRQNFLVPPRSRRSFPLVELL